MAGPGLAIAIVKDDSVVLARGYGVREVGKEATVDEQTVFPLSSNTKAFTAAAIAVLVDEGTLAWDDPVSQHLPSFQPPEGWKPDVTLRDLLSHRMRGQYAYEGGGYSVAGEVVAAVSGTDWGDFVQSRLLQPLGMSSASTTGTGLWDAEDMRPCYECELAGRTVGIEDALIENIAMLHVLDESGPRPIPWLPGGFGAGGSMSANAEDVAKWMRLLLGKGVYGGTRILSAPVVEEILTAQVLASPRYPHVGPGSGHFWTYGFGWYLTDYLGRKAAIHSGSGTGARSLIALLPEENLGVAVLVNQSFRGGELNDLPIWVAFRVIEAYLGAPERGLSPDLLSRIEARRARYRAQVTSWEADRIEGTKPSLPLQSYAGTYTTNAACCRYNRLIRSEGGPLRFKESLEVTITEDDGTLVYRFSECCEGGGVLNHWHYDVFRQSGHGPNRWDGAFFSFVLDPAGRMAELRYSLGGTVIMFKRVPDN